VSTNRPDDAELHDQIRKATEHFTLDRPAPMPELGRPRRAGVQVASLLGAAAAGALVTLLAVGLVARPGLIPGAATPSPTATTTPAVMPTSPAEPGASEVPQDAAQRICLADPGSIPAEWLADGETAAAVVAQIAGLPQVITEQRRHAALFVFADSRFMVVCRIGRHTDGRDDMNIVRGLRESNGDPIAYAGATKDPASLDDEIPLPDLMMFGQADANVARIEILMGDGSTVRAMMAGGVWVAWWNEYLSAEGIRATLSDGTQFTRDVSLRAPKPLD
jgi:hypothetical protein